MCRLTVTKSGFQKEMEKISFVGGGRRQHLFEQVFFVNYRGFFFVLGSVVLVNARTRCQVLEV